MGMLWGRRASGFHRSERTIARAHWKNTVVDLDHHDAARRLCLDGERLEQVGIDAQIGTAVHAQRLAAAGMRNSSATRGSRTMLRSESMRLLPRRSGSISVCASATRTKPGRSPRGEQSSPSGPLVASAAKGEASIAPVVGRDTVNFFDVEASLGCRRAPAARRGWRSPASLAGYTEVPLGRRTSGGER